MPLLQIPPVIIKCSTIGPIAKIGKNVRAPMIRITRIVQIENETEAVGRVPELGGIYFFCANDPASASMETAGTNLPIAIAKAPPSV